MKVSKRKHQNLIILTLTVGCLLLHKIIKKKKSKTKRKEWTKKWLERRNGRGTLALLNKELVTEDPEAYRNFLRLDEAQFNFLLKLVEKDIYKQNTLMRDSVSPRNRLNVTLRFLATGETYRSLMYSTRIHESTISKIVPETCRAICKHLMSLYLKTPSQPGEWVKISMDYENKWNFPNCIGALDGRHITFSPPISSGSYYHNYKGTDSIVLLGLVDANYKFIYANIGVNGRISDGGVFSASKLYEKMQNNTLGLPEPRPLPGRSQRVPYVIVADDAFPLSENLMKPFPQRALTYESRIYNYRLSRARRMVECAFGILANRWRVLLQKINLSPEKVELITLTCVVLHNLLTTASISNQESEYDIKPKQLLQPISFQTRNRCKNSARIIRDEFRDYFNSEGGKVAWQDTAVQRGN